MSRAPAFQFYPADWLRDPELAMATVSSQGIWINLLCQMWFAAERGVLCGAIDQLARLGRCAIPEMERFLEEAEQLRFADVARIGPRDTGVTPMSHSDGLQVNQVRFIIQSRRMVREQKERENAAKRKRQSRANHAQITDESQEGHDPFFILHSSSSDSPSENPNKNSFGVFSAEPENSDSANDEPDHPLKKEDSDSDPEWADDELWLRDFLTTEQTVFTDKRRSRLIDQDWWAELSIAINGFDLGWLRVEFAKMAVWLKDNQARAPTERGVRRFVAGWLQRSAERRRLNRAS